MDKAEEFKIGMPSEQYEPLEAVDFHDLDKTNERETMWDNRISRQFRSKLI